MTMRKQYAWFAGSMAVFVGLPLAAVAADSLGQSVAIVALVLVAAAGVGVLAVRAAILGMLGGLAALLVVLLVMAATAQPSYCAPSVSCAGGGPLVAAIWFLLSALTVLAFGLGRLARWTSDRRASQAAARAGEALPVDGNPETNVAR